MVSGKRSRSTIDDDSDLEEFDDVENDNLMMEDDDEDEEDEGEEGEDEDVESEDGVSNGMGDESEEDGIMQNDIGKDAEIEDLQKDYLNLRNQEQDILKNLKWHKHEDVLKGQAVKNQKTLWDKTLELRFLLQKPFSNSNKLPQETIRSSFCDSNEGVSAAYSDLITSSKRTLDSLLELQEALLEKNPSILQSSDDGNSKKLLKSSDVESDEEWSRISEMHKRIAAFRDKSVDKWQRKAQVTTGAAAIKSKLQAFNQNISEQVASYMRDPSRITKQMQLSRSAVVVFGTALEEVGNANKEDATVDGDPELVDDSEFYQQLLKEFFETVDPASSEMAFYALKKMRTKKRKVVDRRASKSRKIRYNVHEKIVNFMAPRAANIPPMAPKLFSSLFGLKAQQLAPAV